MTNLFAALGWTLAQLALHPAVLARVVAGEAQLLERCALESTRIGQCSVMLRTVMQEVEIDDGHTRYTLEPGVTVATMLALTNTTAAPGPRCVRTRSLGRPPPARRARPPGARSGHDLRLRTAPLPRAAVLAFGDHAHGRPARRLLRPDPAVRRCPRDAGADRRGGARRRPVPDRIRGEGSESDRPDVGSGDAIRRGQRGSDVGRRARHVAVRLEGLGLRLRIRRCRGRSHSRAGARSRDQRDRHRRDLRARRSPSASSARRSASGARRHSSRRKCCR